MDGAAWKIIDGVGYSKKYKYIHTHKKNNPIVYGGKPTQTIFWNFRMCMKPSPTLLPPSF